MRRETLITAPSTEPVSLDEAKIELGVSLTETGHNAYIQSLIASARKVCEDITNRKFITQTWDLFLDAFPSDCFELPNPKLQSITSIKYYDENGSEQTLSTDVYEADGTGMVGTLSLKPNQQWPSLQSDKRKAVAIRYVCGYGDASAVPPTIKQAILFLVCDWYDERGSTAQGTKNEIPNTLTLILASERVYDFA